MAAYEVQNYWCVHYGYSLLSRWITGLTRQQLPPNTQPPSVTLRAISLAGGNSRPSKLTCSWSSPVISRPLLSD